MALGVAAYWVPQAAAKEVSPDFEHLHVPSSNQGVSSLDGSLEPLERAVMGPPRTPGFGSGAQTLNPYNQGGGGGVGVGGAGGRTPGWGNTGRTPNPYNDSRTPAWSANSRTPNPYAEHGKTPAWNSSSRTPNSYASGANNGGASTWGGATPGRPAGSGGRDAWVSAIEGSACLR